MARTPRASPSPSVDDERRGHGAPIFSTHVRCDAPQAPRRSAVTHQYSALMFYTEGHGVLEQHGRFAVSAFDVAIIPAGAPHRTTEAVDLAGYGLGLCAPCLVAGGDAALLAPFQRVRAGGSAIVRIAEDRRAFLTSLFVELAAVTAEQAPQRAPPSVVTSLACLVVHEVERATGPALPHEATAPGVVAEALHYIERHCLQRLSLTDVAAAVGRSKAYVTTALTEATGRSAGAWIVAMRLAEARRLLLHSDEHVDVIAERVGYADPTHFIRMFRRAHGATPSSWRAGQKRERAVASRADER